MRKHHVCNRRLPLREAGMLEFASDDPEVCAVLDELATQTNGGSNEKVWAATYEEPAPLLRLVTDLQRRLAPEQYRHLRCRITYEDGEPEPLHSADKDRLASYEDGEGWESVEFLFSRIGNDRISDLILHRRFTSFMQPIVRPDGDLFGYEFLLRPLPEHPPFRPAELFSIAREAGLHSFLDREARNSAIRVAARHAPNGVKKFVNFLPSSLEHPSAYLKPTIGLIREYGLDPADFVFEIVETEELSDIRHLSGIFDAYREQGIRLAMDDFGEEDAASETLEILRPEYVKLDRSRVQGCHASGFKQEQIDRTLERASRFGGIVLAEGVDDERDWRYLRDSGIALLQGYFFGKPSPVPIPALVGV
ncbi:EAL domain-containing protein [Cohnella algarum]|uniref:EAL domain-containing protein n=1 Tax=Cohnella algarum TaxID=2044859 RepID=UPI0019681F58|nr:EAL domain-containing protein [Cohnella algarum]MBN2982635.1 EAL domain-containing protein [Cohnella algarum]